MSMKKSRLYLLCGGGALVLLASLVLVAGILAGESALHPARWPLTSANRSSALAVAQRTQASLEDVSIPAADGVILRGWAMRPALSNGDAVILLHGHGHNRSADLGQAEIFLRHGYSVLLPDAREHGESGGSIATFGVLESNDIRRWYDWLQAREHPHCIDGLGTSMGAAMILEAMRSTPGFCAVVADAPFDSFREVSYERSGQKYGHHDGLGRTLFRPVIDIGYLWVRLRYGIDMEEASPDRTVAQTQVPALLIHGTADTNLPIRHSRLIMADNPGRPNLQLWEVPGAEHCKSINVDPIGYEQHVIGWFQSHR